MSNHKYCGHISIESGKITIDLGDKILADGVYSIIQESEVKRERVKNSFNPKYKPYDKEEFAALVEKTIGGKEVSMKQVARDIGINEGTFYSRIKNDNLYHLFKLKKPLESYSKPERL